MRSVTLGLLPSTQNEWLRILFESGELEEMLMATYLKALEPENLVHFKAVRIPAPPSGYNDARSDYNLISAENRAKAWKNITEKFKGYFKAVDLAESENRSNIAFLRQMEKFFTEKNMPQQRDRVLEVLNTYEN